MNINPMRFGVTLPNSGLGNDPMVLAELAAAAEDAGWDGVFIWDAGVPDTDVAKDPDDPALLPVVDPWIALTLMIRATERAIVGPMIAPLARRRPWKVAQECVTLDHLSGGRLVLPVGLGWTPDPFFRATGEELDIRGRAQRLDESLAIIDALWRGDNVTFSGAHYQVDGLRLRPLPVQRPRIPVWVVGGFSSARSLQRAARWDGVIPQRVGSEEPLTPDELRQLVDEVGGGEVVVGGLTDERDPRVAAERASALEKAGATWYLEDAWLFMYETPGRPDAILRHMRLGPPR